MTRETKTNTINYGQVQSKNNIQTLRIIRTIREGFEVFLVVIFYEDSKVDTRSFFSAQTAMKTANTLAPKLAKFLTIEEV